MGVAALLVICSVLAWLLVRLFSKPAAADLSHLPETFVIFDLETTGLSPSRNEIIEIGAIKVNRDSDRHLTFQILVRPRSMIPAKISQLTGITQRMVDKEGVALDDALRQFREFVGPHLMVSYNASFDLSFLRVAAAAIGTEFSNPVACALMMARQAWPGRRSYRLPDLAKDGGLSADGTHRALGDCQRAMTVFVAASCALRAVPLHTSQ